MTSSTNVPQRAFPLLHASSMPFYSLRASESSHFFRERHVTLSHWIITTFVSLSHPTHTQTAATPTVLPFLFLLFLSPSYYFIRGFFCASLDVRPDYTNQVLVLESLKRKPLKSVASFAYSFVINRAPFTFSSVDVRRNRFTMPLHGTNAFVFLMAQMPVFL